jgi:hypothetical protein
MELSTMVSGKMTSGMDLEHIFTQTVTSMKGIGTMTFSKVWVRIIIQTETFTRANGRQASQMVKAITFTKVVRPSTKAIGKMERKRDLVSWSLKTIMATQENGKTTKNKETGVTFILMDKSIMANGHATKNQDKELISTKTAIFSSADGKMTDVPVKER